MKNFLITFLLVLFLLLASSCEARVKGLKQQENRNKKRRALSFAKEVKAVIKYHQKQNTLSNKSLLKRDLSSAVTKYDDLLELKTVHTDHGVRKLLFFDALFNLDLGDILGDIDLGNLDLENLDLDGLGGLEDFDLENMDFAGVIEIITTVLGVFSESEGDADGGGDGGKGKFKGNINPTDNVVAVPVGSTVETVTLTTHTITAPDGQVTTLTESSTLESQEISQSQGTQFVPVTTGTKGKAAKAAKAAGKFGKRHV